MRLVAKDTKGLWARGTVDQCPSGFFLKFQSLMYNGPNITPRPGYKKITANSKASVTHMSIFRGQPVSGVVTSKTIVQKPNSVTPTTTEVYNNDDFPATPIYSKALAGTDGKYHSWLNFFGRGYLSLHNRIVGRAATNLQIYEGGASTRDAAGVKPTSVMAGAVNPGGNLGVGTYLVDVCYVTASGFVTKPSGSVLNKDSTGGKKIDLTAIPTSGGQARQIVATRAIPLTTYTGNPDDYEFFKVPDGLLNGTDTTFSVSFFDGDLLDSVNDFINLLESIPMFLGMVEYNGRMIGWGESANPSVLRSSFPGDPEAFDSTSGLTTVDPSESGGITNCFVLYNNLYIQKSNRMFVATDNDGDISTWPIHEIDGGVGSEIYGVCKVLDSKGVNQNKVLVAYKNGLTIFDGVVRDIELTYWIKDIWRSITDFHGVEVFIDPIHKQIYLIIPWTDSPGDSLHQFTDLFIGDYTNGMDPENIRWALWRSNSGDTPRVIGSIILNPDSNESVDVIVALSDMIGTFNVDSPFGGDDDSSGNNSSFSCYIQSPVLLFDNETENQQQINTVFMRQRGGQSTDFTVQGISANDATIVSPIYIFPFKNTTNLQDKWMYLPFVDDNPTIQFVIASTNKPKISQVVIEGDFYGESKPQ